MKRTALLAALLLGSAVAFGQDLNSGYFLENNYFRHRLNPAFAPDTSVRDVFGAFIDNVTLAPQSNLGLSSLVFPYEDRLVTGFSKNISDEEFLKGIKDNNILNLDLNYNIITIGERVKRGGFRTFEINVKSSTSSSIPGSIFTFLKQGLTDNSLDMSNLSISNCEYVEAVLGFSQPIGKYVSLGLRVKGLIGLARADIGINSMNVNIDYDALTMNITSDGYGKVYTPMLNVNTKTLEDGQTVYDLSSRSIGRPAPAGFGAAVDFGVSVKPIKGLEVSVSATDIGGIKWKNNINGVLAADVKTDLTSGDIDPVGLVTKIFNIKPGDEIEKEYIKLAHTIHCGARYAMPFYDKLSFGMMGTFRRGAGRDYNEFRFGAAVAPVKFFSISANVGSTTYGSVFGLAGNVSLGAIQIYAGTDALIKNFAPQYVPIEAVNSVINAGVILQFHY